MFGFGFFKMERYPTFGRFQSCPSLESIDLDCGAIIFLDFLNYSELFKTCRVSKQLRQRLKSIVERRRIEFKSITLPWPRFPELADYELLEMDRVKLNVTTSYHIYSPNLKSPRMSKFANFIQAMLPMLNKRSTPICLCFNYSDQIRLLALIHPPPTPPICVRIYFKVNINFDIYAAPPAGGEAMLYSVTHHGKNIRSLTFQPSYTVFPCYQGREHGIRDASLGYFLMGVTEKDERMRCDVVIEEMEMS